MRRLFQHKSACYFVDSVYFQFALALGFLLRFFHCSCLLVQKYCTYLKMNFPLYLQLSLHLADFRALTVLRQAWHESLFFVNSGRLVVVSTLKEFVKYTFWQFKLRGFYVTVFAHLFHLLKKNFSSSSQLTSLKWLGRFALKLIHVSMEKCCSVNRSHHFGPSSDI